MEGELGRFHTQNVILEQRIEQEGEKLRAAENELHRERRKVRGMIGRFRTASTFSIFHLLHFPPSPFSILSVSIPVIQLQQLSSEE